MRSTIYEMPSVAIFCPQSKAPQKIYLDRLHSFLCQNSFLKPFVQDIQDLPQTWKTFANHREDIAALRQGPRYMKNLSDWITTGKSEPIANVMSGILSLPLLVIIQIGQYFQFLELNGMRHSEFLTQLRNGGGVQGYCGGLLPAMAIACSKDETELAKYASVVMRIALGIGAYGELGDDENIPGPTTIVIRLKLIGQGEEIVSKFPGAHISAVTDPKTISIVGSVPVLAKVQAYAREQGLLVQEMHLRGKVHNPENADLSLELCGLCDRVDFLQLPSVSTLQAPMRSNKTGKLLEHESLSHEAVQTILASRCEWYTLLTELAEDLEKRGRKSHVFATFGIGDCVPLTPFHKKQLRITKLDILSSINRAVPSAPKLREETQYSFHGDAVAVIGVSCRLPGANNLEELWDLISKGTSVAKEVPSDRFDLHRSFRASLDWKFAGKRKFFGNFLDSVEGFDHAFFRTNPREAVNMDPQQRILLELAYEAMESSGYLSSHKREDNDPIGCFIGASFVEYLDNTNSNATTAYTSTGTIRAFLCGKISYYFGWSGPSEVIDTACSSSLVAIHRAVRAIQSGECPMALTGGINIMTGINNYLDLAKAGFLSPTGQCKPFCKSADGYCRAEGGGLIVLKLLKQAVADGDQIFSVIPGAATNQGGLSSSLTIPSSPAQIQLYQNILNKAKMKPDHLSYVEAHGTGTQAGDPLEVASIRQVFGGSERTNPLYLGSIKGNIGHCETGAGVAGLVKLIAMINKGIIPPLASHNNLNPKIPALEPDQMAITTKPIPWNAPFRAACVNSYGAAGSNAAILICEGPRQYAEAPKNPLQISAKYPVILSASTKDSLLKYTKIFRDYLAFASPKLSLDDLAFTLSERRQHHKFRWTTTVSDIDRLIQLLRADTQSCFEIPQVPKHTVLVFGGQSKQTVGLDNKLYQSQPQLRGYIDDCNDLVTNLGFSAIVPAIFQSEPITDIVALQCGTFAMQYACAKCWIDAGLIVDAVVGHSFGELTAMTVAGVLSLHDGIKLIAARASLMQTKWGPERGTMLAIHANKERVKDILACINSGAGELEIACFNAPISQIVVGNSMSITEAEELLRIDSRFCGIKSQRLDVSHGFHSGLTEPLLGDIDELSKTLKFNQAKIPLESCTLNPLDEILPSRLSEHTRDPVYFLDAIRRIEGRLGPCIFLEAGMDSPGIAMVKRAVQEPDNHCFQEMKFRNSQDSMAVLSTITTNLWREGIPVSFWDFLSPSKEAGYKQIWLPPYQFQRTPHWLENIDRVIEAQEKISSTTSKPAEELQIEAPKQLVTSKDGSRREYRIHIDTERFTKIVSGHAVRRQPLCPASMYMECAAMALQIAGADVETKSIFFDGLTFQAPLGVDMDREVSLLLEESSEPQTWTFVVKSSLKTDSKSRSTIHAKGMIGLTTQAQLSTYERLISDRINALVKQPDTEKLFSKRAYGLFSTVVHYSDFLHGISNIIMDGNQAIADIELPTFPVEVQESTINHICDTIALDTFIQVVGLLINSSSHCSSDEVYVATGVDSTIMSASSCNFADCKSWTVYAMFTPTSNTQATGDIYVFTRDGKLVMASTGFGFTKLLITKLEKMLAAANPKVSNNAPLERKLTRTLTPITTPASPTENDSRSSTDDSDDEGPPTPAGFVSGADNLKTLIASYTGLPDAEVIDDASIGDLGIDSLAAVELAEELQTKFGKEIAAEDLMMSSYASLLRIFVSTPQSRKSKPIRVKTTPSKIVQQIPEYTPKHDSNSLQRKKVLQIISGICGAPIDEIRDSAALQDLGVDSLSAVELKSELEDAFSIEIDDDNLSPESTVKEVLKYLGFEPIQQQQKPITVISNGNTSLSNSSERALESLSVVLANPMDTIEKCQAAFEPAAKKLGYVNYWSEVGPKQDELLITYIAEAFRTLDVDLWKLGNGQELPDITYLPKYSKVMARYMEILQTGGIIEKKGSKYFRTSRRLSNMSSNDLLQNLLRQHPAYAAESRLMELTGPKLASCLIGKVDPIALMFGNPAAQRIMGDYYTTSPMLGTLTEQLVDFMRQIVINTTGHEPIRILEVGAGFGGTTTRLAEALQEVGRPVEYTFTDISPSLVKNAKAKFSRYDWMKFQTFNLENGISANMRGQYDIAIGTNCVHATTNKTSSTSHLRETLREGGFVILSEVTKLIDWYDVVYGLLDGWWLGNDTDYPLQPPDFWMECFKKAGFASASYTEGPTTDSNTQRLLVASTKLLKTPSREDITKRRSKLGQKIDTVTYKIVDGVKVLADIFLPEMASINPMPIALMIHGGGHMTLSRKAIRPAQTSFLLANNIIPVSLDYRLCPEVDLINGPIADIRDAYVWAKTKLPGLVSDKGIKIDPNKIVMIGWSTGGHLAMTTAWTTKNIGLEPPCAILAFYSPTDFEAGDLDISRVNQYPGRKLSLDTIKKSLSTRPITNYDAESSDSTGLGWVRPGDPRSELVLSLFKEGNGLSVMLNGISDDDWCRKPDPERVAFISPMAQLLSGIYTTPTFLIHGEDDEIVPFYTAKKFVTALKEHGVRSGFLGVSCAKHIHDLNLRPGMEQWRQGVEPGYDFLFEILSRL
ncbi:putative polyketide synthase protein [Botrytis fragariae]|uniref:Putative polyketide synthase protein n=1 Tax=Botrytis fragariae TaxID=1964551 RepID=A0A8H6AP63_9HELO|nr:putative polyketide synthase protein [Botrytis fragariae]KAF5871074.1 putative polyketide synthase protein [Botrytis fragariae]